MPISSAALSMAITVIGPSVTMGQEPLTVRSTQEPAIQATVIPTTAAFVSESITTADATRPDDANPVFGQWTCRVEGPSGPAIFLIEVKADDRGNIWASVDSDLMGRNDVQEIESAGNGILLRYTGELWGYLAPVVLRLVPHRNDLQISFAIMNGQFEFGGVATRKQ